jgi:DNA-binding NarL/FixJ family response regulator
MLDDHAMVREGTRMLLEKQELGCELLEAGSFAEATRLFALHPDIDWVLLDLGLPDIDGLAALDRLRREHPEVPVVVLSATEERTLVLECVNRGAMGFVGKSASGAALVDALRVVFAGGVHLPGALFGSAPAAAKSDAVIATRQSLLSRLGLTPRQLEVLDLLVQGLSNKVIAERLELSEATVKTHVAASLRALNVKNRTQAVYELAKWGYSPTRRAASTDE